MKAGCAAFEAASVCKHLPCVPGPKDLVPEICVVHDIAVILSECVSNELQSCMLNLLGQNWAVVQVHDRRTWLAHMSSTDILKHLACR